MIPKWRCIVMTILNIVQAHYSFQATLSIVAAIGRQMSPQILHSRAAQHKLTCVHLNAMQSMGSRLHEHVQHVSPLTHTTARTLSAYETALAASTYRIVSLYFYLAAMCMTERSTYGIFCIQEVRKHAHSHRLKVNMCAFCSTRICKSYKL